MTHDPAAPDATPADHSHAMNRRRALGLGAVAAGAAWAAPAILSIDAAAAQTQPACNPCGTVEVTITGCPGSVGGGSITLVDSAGGAQSDTFPLPITVPYLATFQGVCAGAFTVTFLTNGNPSCGTPVNGVALCRGAAQVQIDCLC